MLVSKELVHQDLRGVQLRALEEECKKAARIALDNYNQAMVQYLCTHRWTHRCTHTPPRPPLMWMFKTESCGALSSDMVFSGGILKLKLLIENVK